MKKGIINFVLLVVFYVIAFSFIYMSLTNTGIFHKRIESKFKNLSESLVSNIKVVIRSLVDITKKFSNDSMLKNLFFDKDMGLNQREGIFYLSKLRSNINYAYKILLLDDDGKFFLSSSYQDSSFPEFELIRKKLLESDIALIGNRNVLYVVSKVYDGSGELLGYLAVGYLDDLFLSRFKGSISNIKFVKDLILVNYFDVIPVSDFSQEASKEIKDKIISKSSTMLITSKSLDQYDLMVLFFKSSFDFDFLNIIIIILAIFLALMITIWFFVSIVSEKRLKYVEEIKDSVLVNTESSAFHEYENNSPVFIDDKKKEELHRLVSEVTGESTSFQEDVRYEEIEDTIVPYEEGRVSKVSILGISEIFQFIKSNLNVKKVMYLKKLDNSFVQRETEGFVGIGFYISKSDKAWTKFLSNGKALSIKGNIKELHELGSRFSDDIFEVMIFPVVDNFGEVQHIFVAGREWDDPEVYLENKKFVASKIKHMYIS